MTALSTPTVLFVCVSNAGKSVMAQALLRHLADGRVKALSAGTHAKTAVNETSAQVLEELGIAVRDHRPVQLDDALIAEADLVVVLGGQARVDQPADGTPVRTWDIIEPTAQGIDGVDRMRLIRDDIATRVSDLLRSYGAQPQQC